VSETEQRAKALIKMKTEIGEDENGNCIFDQRSGV
jgi:hypothetical protein